MPPFTCQLLLACAPWLFLLKYFPKYVKCKAKTPECGVSLYEVHMFTVQELCLYVLWISMLVLPVDRRHELVWFHCHGTEYWVYLPALAIKEVFWRE